MDRLKDNQMQRLIETQIERLIDKNKIDKKVNGEIER